MSLATGSDLQLSCKLEFFVLRSSVRKKKKWLWFVKSSRNRLTYQVHIQYKDGFVVRVTDSDGLRCATGSACSVVVSAHQRSVD